MSSITHLLDNLNKVGPSKNSFRFILRAEHGRMAIICVDLGGTLIDDPFLPTIDLVKKEVRSRTLSFPFENCFVENFFSSWVEENWHFDFPFASHFLQEEAWPMRAALKVNDAHDLDARTTLPQMLPAILNSYRVHVKKIISCQPQLEMLRTMVKMLKAEGHVIGVASNDREFATRAMLNWACLDKDLDFVFTSEGLSQKYPGAEKPALKFFHSIRSELGRFAGPDASIVYIGDSELKDIIPSMELGWTPVRFFNQNEQRAAIWLGTSNTTVAPLSYSRFEDALNEARKAVVLAGGV